MMHFGKWSGSFCCFSVFLRQVLKKKCAWVHMYGYTHRSMYTYVHIFACVYMCTICSCVYMHTSACVGTHVCMCTYLCMCARNMWICMHMQVCKCICVPAHAYKSVCMCAYMYVNVYVYCAYVHVCTYACVCVLITLLWFDTFMIPVSYTSETLNCKHRAFEILKPNASALESEDAFSPGRPHASSTLVCSSPGCQVQQEHNIQISEHTVPLAQSPQSLTITPCFSMCYLYGVDIIAFRPSIF
jgi:hypothetical protein